MSGSRKRSLGNISSSREETYILFVEGCIQNLIESSEIEESSTALNILADCEDLIDDEVVRDFFVALMRKEPSSSHLSCIHGISISGKTNQYPMTLEINKKTFKTLIGDVTLQNMGRKLIGNVPISTQKRPDIPEFPTDYYTGFKVKEVTSFGLNTKPNAFQSYTDEINRELETLKDWKYHRSL